jgi:hypothetical protein
LRTGGERGGRKWQEDWRKLHDEELHNLCSLPNITRMIKWRRMRWAGHIAFMQAWEENFGRSRGIWEDNIKMDVKEVVCEGVDWIQPFQEKSSGRLM